MSNVGLRPNIQRIPKANPPSFLQSFKDAHVHAGNGGKSGRGGDVGSHNKVKTTNTTIYNAQIYYMSGDAHREWTSVEASSEASSHVTPSEVKSDHVMQAAPVVLQLRKQPDIAAFGPHGVMVFRVNSTMSPKSSLHGFGSDTTSGLWKVEKHVRLIADTTGDGRGDIVGFGDDGVWISRLGIDNTFDPPFLALEDFGNETQWSGTNWSVQKHIRCMADLRNTGKADICGFGDQGVYVSLNNGDGSFAPAKLALCDLAYNVGWRIENHLRFLADVMGDGFLDIVAFGDQNVLLARGNGDGTFQPAHPIVSNFSCGQGWRVDQHPRFIVPLTQSGRVDIIGFGDAGVYAAINLGNGVFEERDMVSGDFCYSGGWYIDRHPRFVVDLTGDGTGDIIGFGQNGVFVSMNNGDGTFQPTRCVLENFCYGIGWRVEKHPRFVVDLTGDGCADIIGFGEYGVYVSYNDGKGNFGPVTKLTDAFGFGEGQWNPQTTIRCPANVFG